MQTCGVLARARNMWIISLKRKPSSERERERERGYLLTHIVLCILHRHFTLRYIRIVWEKDTNTRSFTFTIMLPFGPYTYTDSKRIREYANNISFCHGPILFIRRRTKRGVWGVVVWFCVCTNFNNMSNYSGRIRDSETKITFRSVARENIHECRSMTWQNIYESRSVIWDNIHESRSVIWQSIHQ